MNRLLLGPWFLMLSVGVASADCSSKVQSPEMVAFKERAERLFVAYTNGTVRHYEVSKPLDCGDELFVLVMAEGQDAGIGGHLSFTYDKKAHTLTIRLGE